MLCARCQSELGIAAFETPRAVNAPRAVETERDARELLARWSAQNILDAAPPSPSVARTSPAVTQEEIGTRPEHRLDPPRPTIPPPSSQFMAASNDNPASSPMVPLDSESTKSTGKKRSVRQKQKIRPQLASGTEGEFSSRHDSAHHPQDNTQPSLDHDHVVRDALQKQLARRTSWSTAAGQLCAYAGVGLLTCGTVLVMWSYFGGPDLRWNIGYRWPHRVTKPCKGTAADHHANHAEASDDQAGKKTAIHRFFRCWPWGFGFRVNPGIVV